MTRRAGKKSDEELHAASTAHMDARSERLEAYVKSLEDALGENPGGEQAERLEGRLGQARKEALSARRKRVPALKPVASTESA